MFEETLSHFLYRLQLRPDRSINLIVTITYPLLFYLTDQKRETDRTN